MDLSFQEKKSIQPIIGSRDIKQKPSLIFFGTPCRGRILTAVSEDVEGEEILVVKATIRNTRQKSALIPDDPHHESTNGTRIGLQCQTPVFPLTTPKIL